jgi:isopentenyl diphosphate isomerase/L-lactate dehydrogenase-like FMN-dependent dehydrogenase
VEELRLAMTLAGCGSVRELDRTWLMPTPDSQPERSEQWSTS